MLNILLVIMILGFSTLGFLTVITAICSNILIKRLEDKTRNEVSIYEK